MAEEKALSVSEVNKKIARLLTASPDLKNVWVKGEISNFNIAPSGHFYFSLKDSASNIRCTFFAGRAQAYSGSPLKDGMEILAMGNINVYEPRGEYSLNVSKVEEVGSGDIFLQVEKLKRELASKGIFDPNHKKPLPKLPKTLGVATSPTGAAIEDIIRIATTNYPNINILVAPCLVQGKDAPDSIASAIKSLNDPQWNVDVIIAGRGGGSYEDLMAFNTEKVVMAYYNSRVPIISAVGHEIDKVLTDYAADMHAPTPTAAAKLAIPEVEAIFEYINELDRRIRYSTFQLIKFYKDRLDKIQTRRSLSDPYHYLEERYVHLDDIITKISLIGKNFISTKKEKLSVLDRIAFRLEQNIERRNNRLKFASERIENFSPLSTLKRGYSVIRNKNKNVIHNSKDVKQGEELELILSQGKLGVVVQSKEK
ncbi:MAG: exodeoxyribonuclease VII large subunit [Leptospira sp.]|nr:exodeoxyribonuclease VII large subunit [Leptospira sp.]